MEPAHGASPVELQQRLVADRRGEPYLLFRDPDCGQRIVPLAPPTRSASIGRAPSCDVSLFWDRGVSRVHVQLERAGDDWTVVDDGLSRNGTLVGGVRLAGRHRLRDGDVLRLDATSGTPRARGPGRRRARATWRRPPRRRPSRSRR
jgi:pSer/pThr/pTyr-binding forkhead associated (FHA) protein